VTWVCFSKTSTEEGSRLLSRNQHFVLRVCPVFELLHHGGVQRDGHPVAVLRMLRVIGNLRRLSKLGQELGGCNQALGLLPYEIVIVLGSTPYIVPLMICFLPRH
jgi:hypothetical protein